jgi:AcrR family transcriptional regulator
VDVLLAATARVLVEEGYERATTNRIAERAGVSVGSLYQYFPHKDALVAALTERHIEQTFAALGRLAVELVDAPLEVGVRAAIETMIALHAVDPALHRVLTEELPRVHGLERLRQINRQAESLVRAMLQSHRARLRVANVELAAFLLVTTIEAATHAAVLDRPDALQSPDLADELSAMVVGYLTAERKPPRPRRARSARRTTRTRRATRGTTGR